MNGEYYPKGTDLIRPSERVLLVVDEDNARIRLCENYDLRIDWAPFRQIIHLAVIRYQQGDPKYRVDTPVAPVKMAHLYRTVWRRAGESWSEYRDRCSRTHYGLSRAGYIPHLMRPRPSRNSEVIEGSDLEIDVQNWNVPVSPSDTTLLGDRELGYLYGYSDAVVLDCINAHEPNFDTLILAGGDSDFWGRLSLWWSRRTRSFFVGSQYDLNRWWDVGQPRFVDFGPILNFYSQVIRPLPWHDPTPLIEPAA